MAKNKKTSSFKRLSGAAIIGLTALFSGNIAMAEHKSPLSDDAARQAVWDAIKYLAHNTQRYAYYKGYLKLRQNTDLNQIIRVAQIDLNRDGRPEIIGMFTEDINCDDKGCQMLILSRRPDNSWRIMSPVFIGTTDISFDSSSQYSFPNGRIRLNNGAVRHLRYNPQTDRYTLQP